MTRLASVTVLAVAALAACRHDASPAARAEEHAAPPADAVPPPEATPTPRPAADGRPLLGIRGFAVTVYAEPSTGAKKIGYLRVGAQVPRTDEPVSRKGCRDGWYGVEPAGFVCAGEEATVDLDDPLLRAAARRPERDKPLPYRYGFVRAVTPLYVRVPSSQLQHKFEFKLGEHLEWFKEHRAEVEVASLGAADLAVDELGRVIGGKKLGELGMAKNSSEMSVGELFGGHGDEDPWPFWLRDGERLIPNISGFAVPEYAVFADRARRHAGLAFIGTFTTDEQYLKRRFAVTSDLRLAPTTKVKPDAGSPWHGVEIGGDLQPPFAFVRRRGVQAYKIDGGVATSAGELERRGVERLTGKVTKVEGERYLELADGRWGFAKDLGVVVTPSKWPTVAKKGAKWIEIDLSEQTLVLWNGKTPEFATLVSTGRPAIGDPETDNSTPRGVFQIYSKHVTATMDSDEGIHRENGDTTEKTLKPGDEGYVPEKGDGVYGVTLRRGHGLFVLRDVPYIQYFKKQYAIHGAYWHDVFGIPRSHGCVNLSPADALRVFKWTEPAVPPEWHGINIDDGTTVVIHK
jgi:lipoprotein-anchoring transpeptidase ErfK/SrfK